MIPYDRWHVHASALFSNLLKESRSMHCPGSVVTLVCNSVVVLDGHCECSS